MMWYPTPFQREFFGYFTEASELLGGEPLSLSRWKTNEGLKQVQKTLEKRSRLWRALPYVEQVCLTGKASFNTAENDIEAGVWVVASAKRLWSSYLMIKLVFWCINIRNKKKWLPILRIDAFQEETDLNIQMIKDQEFDVLPIYQLAHLSLLYQKFPKNSRSIYDDNKRINEYLANFPLQFVIACGIPIQNGKNRFGKMLESLFGNVVGDLCNMLSKRVILLVFMIIKNTKWTSLRVSDSLIWRDIRNKDEYMLSRKVLRKTIEEL